MGPGQSGHAVETHHRLIAVPCLGQGLIDGSFDHVGKIKGPILRVFQRAPYFHNGSAQTLLDAVHFYENRFGLVLTRQEESDLVAFLQSL
jgi:cytochrome c peroxidase